VSPIPAECDLLVVGGGVNGAGIARDAAGRGLSVVLCEQHDLASHTSSASTKLVHGGLRYLEHLEFGLVRKALEEREVLLAAAPHIVRPLRFILPHDDHLRPAWLIRAGLFLYDHLAHRERLPGSEGLDLRAHPAGVPLLPGHKRGFAYSDGWVDDARLVVLNAVDAAERGARVLTGTPCRALERDATGWRATLEPAGAPAVVVRARAVVNATGPWVGEFLAGRTPAGAGPGVRLVKGSHVVVPRLFDHDDAYLFQNDDRRIVFAIHYERDYTLLGTTEVEFTGDPATAAIDAEEVAYLCATANRHFVRQIAPADVVWSYSGVRPLVEDNATDAGAVTRDWRLELDLEGAPLLSVFGGKITTYRRLAEEALERLAPLLGADDRPWTAGAPLPGGDVRGDFDAWAASLPARHPGLPAELLARWAHSYGTRLARIVGDARRPDDLGPEVAPGLPAAELRYLREVEFARTAEDVLWRRSKLGLHLPRAAAGPVDEWLARPGD
jgi:glycerol-3-phosphate dehydrogenase